MRSRVIPKVHWVGWQLIRKECRSHGLHKGAITPCFCKQSLYCHYGMPRKFQVHAWGRSQITLEGLLCLSLEHVALLFQYSYLKFIILAGILSLGVFTADLVIPTGTLDSWPAKDFNQTFPSNASDYVLPFYQNKEIRLMESKRFVCNLVVHLSRESSSASCSLNSNKKKKNETICGFLREFRYNMSVFERFWLSMRVPISDRKEATTWN